MNILKWLLYNRIFGLDFMRIKSIFTIPAFASPAIMLKSEIFVFIQTKEQEHQNKTQSLVNDL